MNSPGGSGRIPRARVASCVALGALAQAGFACGLTAMDALFLAQAGSRTLAYVYLLTPVLMAIAIFFFTWVLNRWHAKGQLQTALCLCAAVGLTLWSLYRGPQATLPTYVHVLSLLAVNMWLYCLYSAFWNFADSLFSTREARGTYGYLAAGICAGYVVGGFFSAQAPAFMAPHELFLVWSVVALACIPASELIARRFPIHIRPQDPAESSGTLQRLRAIARGFRESPYARSLAALFFLVIVMALLSEYLYLSAFERHARAVGDSAAEVRLTNVLGTLIGVANVLNIALAVVVFPRLVRLVGVRGAALVLPLAYIALFVCVSIQMSQPLAVVAFLVYQTLQISIDQSNQNLLVRALPGRVAQELRTVIEGASEPLAVALVGLFLLPELSAIVPWAGAERLQPTDIGLVGLATAVVTVVVALAVRAGYYPAVRANVGKGASLPRERVTAQMAVRGSAARVCTRLDQSLSAGSDAPREYLGALHHGAVDKECAQRLLAYAPLLDTHARRLLEQLLFDAGLRVVPALAAALRDPLQGLHARVLAATALSRHAPRLYLDTLGDLEAVLCADAQACVQQLADVPDTARTCLWARWLRQRGVDAVDLLVEMVSLAGRIPDAVTVRRMLRSGSPFDRSEALDTLEQGLGGHAFAMVLPAIELHRCPPQTRWSDPGALPDGTVAAARAGVLTTEPGGLTACLDVLAGADRTACADAAVEVMGGGAPAALKCIAQQMAFGTGSMPGPAERLREALRRPECAQLELRALYHAAASDGTRAGLLACARRHASLARSLFYQWAA